MERLLSIGNDGRKKQVRAELKPYRAIFKVDEALKIPENTLERLLLQEVRGTYETSEKSENLFMDLHESMTADYFAKLTAATVFFSHAILGLRYSGHLITITTVTRDKDKQVIRPIRHDLLQVNSFLSYPICSL